MEIPATCDRWVEMVRSGGEAGAAILRNLQCENCIPQTTCDEFFDEIAKASASNFKDSLDVAANIVSSSPDKFLFLGRIPPKELFNQLFRIEKITSMSYRMPKFMNEAGLTDADLQSMTVDQLNSLFEEFSDKIALGNCTGVSWATNFEAANHLFADPNELLNRLGIPARDLTQTYISFVYQRDLLLQDVHVPRIFEGIRFPEFKIQVDCANPAGITRPLTGPENHGLPEIVHISCEVVPSRVAAGELT